MMQNTKALFLGALFLGMGTVTAINEIGIGLYPPSGQFPDGVIPPSLMFDLFDLHDPGV